MWGVLLAWLVCGLPRTAGVGGAPIPTEGGSAPRVVSRVEFSVRALCGDPILSLDGRHLLLVDQAQEGCTLKRVDLASGSVETLGILGGLRVLLAAIPDSPSRLVIGRQHGSPSEPFEVLILDTSAIREDTLLQSDRGSDGRLAVSPSGRFLLVGASRCSSSRGAAPPHYLEIYSLDRGERVAQLDLTALGPVAAAAAPNGRGTDVEISAKWLFTWDERDAVILTRVPEEGVKQRMQYRRDSTSSWVLETMGGAIATPAPEGSQSRTEWLGEEPRSLTVRVGHQDPAVTVEVDLHELFGKVGGFVSILHSDDRAVVLLERPPQGATKQMTAVTLLR